MAGQTRSLWDFEDREDWWTRADADGIAQVVAVPTTSGTGSEVGRASVITDVRDHTKKIIFHPKMMPVAVIADPALTVGLPASVTAAVGMDALSHNLEAWCSPVFHPMAHGIALEGMRLVKEWLPAACEDGADLAGAACMQVASTMGATAFQKGLGAMHSMSHPCGAVYDTHHGLTNAVVMPYVLEFNRASIEDKMAALARYLGLDGTGFEAVQRWILELRDRIGIPRTLTEIGVPTEAASRLAPMALVTLLRDHPGDADDAALNPFSRMHSKEGFQPIESSPTNRSTRLAGNTVPLRQPLTGDRTQCQARCQYPRPSRS